MKYARLTEDTQRRIEAVGGAFALCPLCEHSVVGQKGKGGFLSWRHVGDVTCDAWQETENKWKRAWKNDFPDNEQEVVVGDVATGERHLADVKTARGLVVQFQNADLDLVERRRRELFFGNLLWVVNAARLKSEVEKFQKARLVKAFRLARPEINPLSPLRFSIPTGMIQLYAKSRDIFPAAWLDVKIPVVFDYTGCVGAGDCELWCLMPETDNSSVRYVVGLHRQQLLEGLKRKSGLLEPEPKQPDFYLD